MLNQTRKLYGKRPAYKIKMGEGTYKTYSHEEARKQIDALGTALISLGLKRKRIAIIGENRVRMGDCLSCYCMWNRNRSSI